MAAQGPRTLRTLPPEGLVLEEVIDAMREEYGYPATPQEYRLILRIAPDEPERSGGGRPRRSAAAEAQAAPAGQTDVAEGGEPGPSADGVIGTAPRRGRLRRRRRGRGRGGGGAAGGGAGRPAAGPEPGGAAGGGAGPSGGEGSAGD